MESVKTKSGIRELCDFGQSVWLDNISRSLIDSGELSRLIDLGITGVTSNPTIFDKAISGSPDYDDKIKELKNRGLGTFEIYDELTVRDIQDAASLFYPIYKETEGLDGYVSLEVNPLLAHKTKETIKEAERLYKEVNRPNLMLKIPATEDGFYAGRKLLSKGINVNFTLIFSLGQYLKTTDAFIKGAEEFLQSGGNLERIFSVASIFVSRIDTLVDKFIDEKINALKSRKYQDADRLLVLKGKAAVANVQLIFDSYLEKFSRDEFLRLESQGLKRQRALWASTSTKNPAYSDIKYVTELIGKNTINTMPTSTIEAFLEHGIIKDALGLEISQANEIVGSLNNFGIDIDKVCAELLRDGVLAFENSFNSLLKTIELKESKL